MEIDGNKINGYGRIKIRSYHSESAQVKAFIASLPRSVDEVSGIEPISRLHIEHSDAVIPEWQKKWVWEHPLTAEVTDKEADFSPFSFDVVLTELYDPVFKYIGEDEDGNQIGWLSGFFCCEGMEVPTSSELGKIQFDEKKNTAPDQPLDNTILAGTPKQRVSRSCFDRPSQTCFSGPGACFSAPVFPAFGGGCFKAPCFNYPLLRIGWNILSLLGSFALLLAIFCALFCTKIGSSEEGDVKDSEENKVVKEELPSEVEGGQSAIRSELRFNVADHKDIDGDVIDLYINEELIAENVELFLDPIELTTNELNENEVNVLKIVPKSVGTGSLEVCTARIELIDACSGITMPPFLLQMKMGQVGTYYLFVESLECP